MTDIKEAHGLEVVAWQDAENPLYVTGEKRQMHGWATDGYPIVELIRLSDATALIDQLRERVVELESQQSAPAQPQSDDARDALVVALDALIADYDGEIHNEYDGTNELDSRLSEINYAREALAAYRAAMESKGE